MNLTTDRNHDISIVRVNEARLMYPLLPEFAGAVTPLIGTGNVGWNEVQATSMVGSAQLVAGVLGLTLGGAVGVFTAMPGALRGFARLKSGSWARRESKSKAG